MDRRRGIQIDDDPAFQRKSWMFERAGWAVLAIMLAAAMLGAFGSGPLSSVRVEEGGLTLSYQRVLRYQAPSQLVLDIRHDGAPVRVFVGREWLEKAVIERTSPDSAPPLLKEDGVVLVFPTDPAARSGHIRLDFRTDGLGWHHGPIGVDGGARVRVRALVLP